MLTRKMWNDGPPLLDLMGREGAPAIASKHLCFGGGGGSSSSSSAPDYTNYIGEMSKIGARGQEYATNLYNWAQQQGLDLQSLSKRISGQAEGAATGQQGRADSMVDDWKSDYDPLYKSQRDDATRMYKDLPQTEEAYAGKFGADTAQGIDQQLAAEKRSQEAYGISPGVGATALDTQARIGRAAATTASAEQGRMQARTEARNVTDKAIQTGQFIPGVAGQQAGLATANRQQSVALPNASAQTSAGLYSPSLGYYQAATPYMKAWGDTMLASERNNLEREKMASENDDGGIMGTVMPLVGGIAGSYFGPMGSAMGASLGKAAAGGMSAKTGGKIPKNGGRRIPRRGINTRPPMFRAGGPVSPPDDGGEDDMPFQNNLYPRDEDIDQNEIMDPMYMQNEVVQEAAGGGLMGGAGGGNMITPEMSPSGGEKTDDVHAMVSEGEFVIPERTVDWYGEKFFQNLIAKADGEAQEQTVAEPEETPMDGQQAAALNTMPPMFRSEGARA